MFERIMFLKTIEAVILYVVQEQETQIHVARVVTAIVVVAIRRVITIVRAIPAFHALAVHRVAAEEEVLVADIQEAALRAVRVAAVVQEGKNVLVYI